MGIGQSREVAFGEDRGAEAWFREYHHARRGLHEVGAGSRADHEEECVLHFSMQPDDARKATEDFALAALAEHWQNPCQWWRCRRGTDGGQRAHHASARADSSERPGALRLAARSFSRNWVALMT